MVVIFSTFSNCFGSLASITAFHRSHSSGGRSSISRDRITEENRSPPKRLQDESIRIDGQSGCNRVFRTRGVIEKNASVLQMCARSLQEFN